MLYLTHTKILQKLLNGEGTIDTANLNLSDQQKRWLAVSIALVVLASSLRKFVNDQLIEHFDKLCRQYPNLKDATNTLEKDGNFKLNYKNVNTPFEAVKDHNEFARLYFPRKCTKTLHRASTAMLTQVDVDSNAQALLVIIEFAKCKGFSQHMKKVAKSERGCSKSIESLR